MYHNTAVRFSAQQFIGHCGEIGRHEGLKIPFWRQSAGSSPAGGMKKLMIVRWFVSSRAFCFAAIKTTLTIKPYRSKSSSRASFYYITSISRHSVISIRSTGSHKFGDEPLSPHKYRGRKSFFVLCVTSPSRGIVPESYARHPRIYSPA